MRLPNSLDTLTPTTEVPALISVEALALHWGIRPDTIRAWVRADKIKGVKVPGIRKVLIDVKSLPHAKA